MLIYLALLPISFLTVILLEKSSLIDILVSPITSRLVSETHQFYLAIFLQTLISLALATIYALKTNSKNISGLDRFIKLEPIISYAFLSSCLTSLLCKVPFIIRFHLASIFVISHLASVLTMLCSKPLLETFFWFIKGTCCIVLFFWSIFPSFETYYEKLPTLL